MNLHPNTAIDQQNTHTMSQIMLPAHIDSPSMVSLNKRNQHSLLSRQDAHGKLEVQGFYWPRVLIRPTEKAEKKEDKKPCKIKRKTKNFNSSSSAKFSSTLASETSLLELLRFVPALVSEDHCAATSPITGKPILSPKINKSLLIPTKPVRKQLLRRSQSNSTSYSLD